MINGSFDRFGRPYVQGRLVIPGLNVDGNVDLLADTGADSTALHADDAVKLSVPFDRLSNRVDIDGIGGSRPYFIEPAFMIFVDGSQLRLYTIQVSIQKPADNTSSLPSLLGRDILNHWYMRYDPTNRFLGFVVRHADVSQRV